jgi:hypothetical protein
MTVEELEREIMALSGAERAELLTRLERRALYDNRFACVLVESNDLRDEGREKPIARVFHFRFPRTTAEANETIDIFSEVANDPTFVTGNLMKTFIRRWDFIIRNKHRFSDHYCYLATHHLNRLGTVLVDTAKSGATPKEHVIAEGISEDEFYYLKQALVALRDPKIKRAIKRAEEKDTQEKGKVEHELVRKRLHGNSAEMLHDVEQRWDEDSNEADVSNDVKTARSKIKSSSLRDHQNHHGEVIEQVLNFLSSNLRPSSNREDAWRNAYIAWRVNASPSTVKTYLSTLRRATQNDELDDITKAIVNYGRQPREENYCADMFLMQLPFTEILKFDLR